MKDDNKIIDIVDDDSLDHKKKSKKKNNIWCIIVVVLLCFYVLTSFLVNIINKNSDDNTSQDIKTELIENRSINRAVNDETVSLYPNDLTVINGLIQNEVIILYSTDSNGYPCILNYKFGNLKLYHDYDKIGYFELTLSYTLDAIGFDEILTINYGNVVVRESFNPRIPISSLSDDNIGVSFEFSLYEESEDEWFLFYNLTLGDFGYSVNINNYTSNNTLIISEVPYDSSSEKYGPGVDSSVLYNTELSVYSTILSSNPDNIENPLYQDGYRAGYDYGYTIGSLDGYDEGYVEGEKSSVSTNYFKTLFNAILNAPYNIYNGLFNFEIFGVNLFAFFSFIFTTLTIIAIIKFFRW